MNHGKFCSTFSRLNDKLCMSFLVLIIELKILVTKQTRKLNRDLKKTNESINDKLHNDNK